MKELICSRCGTAKDPEPYTRKDGTADYKQCQNCGSKGKPVKPLVLVIPDTHAPFHKKGYIDFVQSIYEENNCNAVVHLGDEADYHYSSYHESDPDGLSAEDELRAAVDNITELAKVFPYMRVCYGNHSLIPKRKAFSSALSKHLVKSPKQVYLDMGAPVENWVFAESFDLNGVHYTHGNGRKAKSRMERSGNSIVQGHYHHESYIHWLYNENQCIFAMQLGALIDWKAYAFAYNKSGIPPHHNCAVVNDKTPTIYYMEER